MGTTGSLPRKFNAHSRTTYAAVVLSTPSGRASEGDILSVKKFLGEEVDGALTTHKISGEATTR